LQALPDSEILRGIMRPTILLIDVPSTDRANWKGFLETQSYEVFTAGDGEAAQKQCLLLHPDVVLLRDTLPGIDGFELCRRLKENPLNQLVPIVLIQSSTHSTDVERGRRAGDSDFWGTCTSIGEGLSRVQSLLRLKNYIDEQAKSVVLSLARSIEAKDSLSERHSERMVQYAVQLGHSLGFEEQELEELQIACLLHDVGKVAVPHGILMKPGPLNEDELEIVKRHPITGENICAPVKLLRSILPLIRHHHERVDGSGYPDGLCGEHIPMRARVLQIADIYDALITERPYRVALSSREALEILDREAHHGWLDTSLVRRFSRLRQANQCHRGRGGSILASFCNILRLPKNVVFS